MLMILLSTLSLIKHMFCGNIQQLAFGLEYNYKTLLTGVWSGLSNSLLEKLSLFQLISQIALTWMLKMVGYVLEEKCFSSESYFGSHIVSIAKTATKKTQPLICSMKSFSSEIALYLYKSTIRLRNYINGYVKLLVLHFLAPLNSWLIVKIQAYYRSPPLQNYNFSKCVNWGTGQDRFVSWKSYFLFSRYSRICIYNHPMIYQICDVAVSISTWDRVHFWIYLLNLNLLSPNLELIDISKGNNFQESFIQFGGLEIHYRFFSIWITNDVKIVILVKPFKGPVTSFRSPALGSKHVRHFYIQHTKIGWNFSLIVLMIQKK